LGWDIDASRVTIYDSGDQEFDTSTVEQLVRAVTSVLKHPEETKNTYVFVNSFTFTQNKVLSALERLQGKKYEVLKDTTASIYASGTQKLSSGDVATGYPEIVTASVYAPWKFSSFPADEVTKWKQALELTEVDDSDTVVSSVLRKKGLLS
jgi:nucleoside-diphosphate-sugar epimerase